MTAPNETRIMLYILAQLRVRFPGGLWERQNVLVAKAGTRTVRAGTVGQGDIRGCYRGRYIEIEVKTPTGRQSPEQRKREHDVTAAGGVYVVAHSLEEALAAIGGIQ
jgi:hypothetical protein